MADKSVEHVEHVRYIDIPLDEDEMYCPVCGAGSDSVTLRRVRWYETSKRLTYGCECHSCGCIFQRVRIVGNNFVRLILKKQPRGFRCEVLRRKDEFND